MGLNVVTMTPRRRAGLPRSGKALFGRASRSGSTRALHGAQLRLPQTLIRYSDSARGEATVSMEPVDDHFRPAPGLLVQTLCLCARSGNLALPFHWRARRQLV